jgi:tRNA-dihydrouridine synthase B
MKIGTLDLGTGIFLAPMAGVTDLPFRILCREKGCSLASTEMVSAKAIYYGNKDTADLLKSCAEDRPLAVQLFGSEPELMTEMALRIEEGPFALIDINMGCPVPKVVKNGEGSALMKNPALAGKIVAAMTRKLKKPVTVKIRAGFDETHKNAAELARILEASGAAAITVHGRTREQYYSGRADRSIIREVKEAVRIPVIGNGDIFTAEDARQMLAETGCDGVMVARGAEGNPWIFSEIRSLLETGKLPEKPSAAEKRELVFRHLAMEMEQSGEKAGILKMRKHISWYLHGLPNAAQIRNAVNNTENLSELQALIDRAFSL